MNALLRALAVVLTVPLVGLVLGSIVPWGNSNSVLILVSIGSALLERGQAGPLRIHVAIW